MIDKKRIDCAQLARRIIHASVSKVRARGSGVVPKVCAVQIGEHAAPWTQGATRHAQRIVERELQGEWEMRMMSSGATVNELLSTIAALNNDINVHGVVIVRPVPDHLSIKLLQQAVDPGKDIEGMHPGSIGKVVYGNKSELEIMYPCTARASVQTLKQGLEELGKASDLRGVEALVVGNSDVLAKPICSILHAEGATVTVCNHDIANLAAFTRSADVVFSAANAGPGIIRGDMLKPDSVLIDLGMNVGPDGSFLGGDADVSSCLSMVSKYSGLNYGIGVVRSAVLASNLALSVSNLRAT